MISSASLAGLGMRGELQVVWEPWSTLLPPTLHQHAQMALLPEKKSVPSAGAGEAVLSCEPGRGGFRGGAEQGLGGKALELPGAIWPDLDRWLVGTGQWVASSHGGR